MTSNVNRPSRRSIWGARFQSVWPPITFLAALLLAWWAVAAWLDSTVVPTPGETWAMFGQQLSNSRFQSDALATVRVVGLAFIAVLFIGTLAGLLLGMSPFWSRAITPIIYMFNSVPKIVFFPIFLMFLGLGDLSRGVYAFASGVLPMLLIAEASSASVSRSHLKLAASLRLSRRSVISKILIPTALPGLATGARVSFGMTFLALIVAELFAGSGGLGNQLLTHMTQVRLDRIAAVVVVILGIALVPAILLRWLEVSAMRRFGGPTDGGRS